MIRKMKFEAIVFVLGFIAGIYLLVFAPAWHFAWHPLVRSPERVTEILYTTVDTVTVKTISDKKYSCNIYDEKECWIEINYESIKGNLLWCFPEDYSTEHTVQIAKACNQSHSFGILGTIYSLNDNGTVYVKHKGYIGPDGYFFGAIIGLICALIAFLGKQLYLRASSLSRTSN